MIERLAVLPDYRHNSVGLKLMKHALNIIKTENGKRVEVEIVNENWRLNKWYIDQGFIKIRIDQYSCLPFNVGVFKKII